MSAIIFDFDGTIADSFDYVADFLVQEAGLPKMSAPDKAYLKEMSMIGMARSLGLSWLRLPFLFIKGRRRMQQAVHQVEPFEGMPEVIRKLHAEGHELFLMSSNNVHNIHKFLHHHDLHKYFLEIYGGVGLFGKAPALRRLLREHQFESKDCVFIGDEGRDVEAAQSLKVPVIAVTWGFASPEALAELKPSALARQPDDIIGILEEL